LKKAFRTGVKAGFIVVSSLEALDQETRNYFESIMSYILMIKEF
jgi:hypothetical protein